MAKPRRWAIVGGGMLGMTLAWDLARDDREITLFESAPTLGGLAAAWQLGDVVWDRHYHVTLLSDNALRGLLAELDLEKEMCWSRTQTGFYGNGKLYPFSSAADFARFPLLNPVEKLRFGVAILRASRLASPDSIDHLTVEEWLTRISGKGVFEKIWRPLLRAKLGENYRSTSATFMWATIQRLYAARRSGLREELFGYLPGGYARMLDRFGSALRKRNIRVHLNSRVRQVTACSNEGVSVDSDSGPAKYDRAILTVPSALAARLCPQLTQPETDQLNGVKYEGIICTSLLLKRSLSPYYVTNIVDASIPLTGVIEMSALVDKTMFKGRALVYLPRYLPPDHPAFEEPDEQIASESIAALRRMHPALQDDDVLACRVSRARYVYPRPIPGSAKRVAPVDTSVPGIHILNSANIIAGTLNVNETVQLARREARRLHELATNSSSRGSKRAAGEIQPSRQFVA
jgi:protoporphyrinogen oxidase